MHLPFVFDDAFGEFAIGPESAGDVAGADAVEGAFEQRDVAGVEMRETFSEASSISRSVADEAEAGDVGEGVDGKPVVRRSVVGRWLRSFAPPDGRGRPSPLEFCDHFGGGFVQGRH